MNISLLLNKLYFNISTQSRNILVFNFYFITLFSTLTGSLRLDLPTTFNQLLNKRMGASAAHFRVLSDKSFCFVRTPLTRRVLEYLGRPGKGWRWNFSIWLTSMLGHRNRSEPSTIPPVSRAQYSLSDIALLPHIEDVQWNWNFATF